MFIQFTESQICRDRVIKKKKKKLNLGNATEETQNQPTI